MPSSRASSERMAQRRDHGTRGEAHRCVVAAAIAESRTSELGHGIGGILVPGHRVVARVPHDPLGPGARAEHDVLAHHDRVEAGVFGDSGHLDERAQVARRRERPVLAQDEDELEAAQRGTPATSAAAASTAARWCGRSSWPGMAAR